MCSHLPSLGKTEMLLWWIQFSKYIFLLCHAIYCPEHFRRLENEPRSLSPKRVYYKDLCTITDITFLQWITCFDGVNFFHIRRTYAWLFQTEKVVLYLQYTYQLTNCLILVREEQNRPCLETIGKFGSWELKLKGTRYCTQSGIVLKVGGPRGWAWAKSAESTQGPNSFKPPSIQN